VAAGDSDWVIAKHNDGIRNSSIRLEYYRSEPPSDFQRPSINFSQSCVLERK